MANFDPYTFDPTAFMSGQIGSKVWLCEKLEPLLADQPRPAIWLLAGWYGMTNFLLRARGRVQPSMVASFDIDPEARKGALVLNENYEFEHTFFAYTADVNTLVYDIKPDVVINTSTEHIPSREWYERIPEGTLCAFQSNDMPHDDHVHVCHKPEDLAAQFPLSQTFFLGSKAFVYPTWAFTRFMHIGVK